jgi:hypothetical protein
MAVSYINYYTSREGCRLEDLPPQIIVCQKLGEPVAGIFGIEDGGAAGALTRRRGR